AGASLPPGSRVGAGYRRQPRAARHCSVVVPSVLPSQLLDPLIERAIVSGLLAPITDRPREPQRVLRAPVREPRRAAADGRQRGEVARLLGRLPPRPALPP